MFEAGPFAIGTVCWVQLRVWGSCTGTLLRRNERVLAIIEIARIDPSSLGRGGCLLVPLPRVLVDGGGQGDSDGDIRGMDLARRVLRVLGLIPLYRELSWNEGGGEASIGRLAMLRVGVVVTDMLTLFAFGGASS